MLCGFVDPDSSVLATIIRQTIHLLSLRLGQRAAAFPFHLQTKNDDKGELPSKRYTGISKNSAE